MVKEMKKKNHLIGYTWRNYSDGTLGPFCDRLRKDENSGFTRLYRGDLYYTVREVIPLVVVIPSPDEDGFCSGCPLMSNNGQTDICNVGLGENRGAGMVPGPNCPARRKG